ncbi:AAA family ATPase [soil metagenome]
MARKRRTTPGPYLLHLELLRDRIPDASRFPYNLPAVRGLEKLAFHPKVTFLVGENGSGKSTLLEAVAEAYGLNPEGGSQNFNFATRASHSSLGNCVRLAKTVAVAGNSYFLRAESFYNVASEIDRIGDGILSSYGGKSLHEQSHGESFFALFEHRFSNHGMFLLDEPEAALSPRRQLQFLALLHDYVKGGSQFVIATHSPIILAYPDSLLYLIDEAGIRPTAYEETEHYAITRGFLSNPKRSLAELFKDDEAEIRNAE